MAILAIFTGSGITQSMYEALRKEVHWENRLPPGAVVHAAGFDAAGHLHVADVWDSEAAMNAFVQQRLLPAMQKLKVPAPKVEVFPLHNLNAYPTIENSIVR